METKTAKMMDLGVLGSVPEYVISNPVLNDDFIRYRFFPWMDVHNVPRAYVVDNNGILQVVSDFYMEPLVHLVDGDINIRIVRINHLNPKYDKKHFFHSCYLTNLTTFQKGMFDAGAYNFSGSRSDFEHIKHHLSYHFETSESLIDLIEKKL